MHDADFAPCERRQFSHAAVLGAKRGLPSPLHRCIREFGNEKFRGDCE
jgi:hypothetical protein